MDILTLESSIKENYWNISFLIIKYAIAPITKPIDKKMKIAPIAVTSITHVNVTPRIVTIIRRLKIPAKTAA